MEEKVSELRSLQAILSTIFSPSIFLSNLETSYVFQRALFSKCVDGQGLRGNSEEKPFTPWNIDILTFRIRYKIILLKFFCQQVYWFIFRSKPASCFPYGLTEKSFVEILQQRQLDGEVVADNINWHHISFKTSGKTYMPKGLRLLDFRNFCFVSPNLPFLYFWKLINVSTISHNTLTIKNEALIFFANHVR